jgi:hypothetical protein
LRAKQGRQFFSTLSNNDDGEYDDGDDAEMPQRKRSRIDIGDERNDKGNTLAHDTADDGVSDTVSPPRYIRGVKGSDLKMFSASRCFVSSRKLVPP